MLSVCDEVTKYRALLLSLEHRIGMKSKAQFAIKLFCILAAGLLGGCSSLLPKNSTISDADVLLTAQAANPLPTQLAGQGLTVVKTKACQIFSLVSVQVDSERAQGDMMAWSPAGNYLAYVTPENDKWGWFVGRLVVLDAAKNKEVFSTQAIEVAGDLTWSPDGKKLAYVVLNAKDKYYTVYVADIASGEVQDVFGGSSAQTDEWSSPKGINKWDDSSTLEVTSSCDVDCSRNFSYNADTGKLNVGEDTRKQDDHSLEVTNENTSPNSRWQIAVDLKDNVWMSSAITHQAAVISSGLAINEIKWSGDSNYLALRTDESILVIEPVCKK